METDHSDKDSDKVYAFDSLFTTNHIQMLKVIAGYLPPPLQGQLAVYIRFLELNYTMRFFRENPFARINSSDAYIGVRPDVNTFSGLGGSNGMPNFSGILNEILPFCNPEEKEKVQNFQNIFQSMENIQEMMQMMDMMREFMQEMPTDNNDGETANENSSGNIFPGFGSAINWPELSQMMDMMQTLQGENAQTDSSDNSN